MKIIKFVLILILITGINMIFAQTSFNVSNKTTGDTLLTISNNGRIGIGTTTPVVTIDVKSDVVEHATSLCLGNSDDSHWLQLYSGRGGTSPLSPLMLWQEGDPMRFASWGATYNEYMRLSAEGNLGIGTTTPTTKLEVADTIYSTVGGFKFPDGSIQATAAGAGSGNTLDQAYDQDGAGVGRTITADAGAFEVNGFDGVVFTGAFGSGTIPIEGEGTRMMWYPRRSAIRAGSLSAVVSNYWDADSIGPASVAMGASPKARGIGSTAFGYFPKAEANYSTAMGIETTASGGGATAMGTTTTASGSYSTAMGIDTEAFGIYSTAMGIGTRAHGSGSTTMGYATEATGDASTAMGNATTASGIYSTAMGERIQANGSHTVAIALSNQNGLSVTQDNTMAIMGGKVGIDASAPAAELQVGGTDGVLFTGTYGSGTISATGEGTRMMWYPAKAAFRAGYVDGIQWDDANIGNYSIALGYGSIASNLYSTAMGAASTASGHASTAMGRSADATGTGSVALGDYTEASGSASTALGRSTIASGGYSSAMGAYINTSGTGSFAIGDYSTTSAPTFTTDNRFYARFANGYRLYTNSTLTSGAEMLAGANSWSTISDSTKKENFKTVDGEDFLNKISKFNLTSWNYKGQDPSKFRHYGPMAQDFYAAFGNDGIGTIGNDTTLASADFDGINFIAIQALEKRTHENRENTKNLKEENQHLKEEISLLKSKIEKLESLYSKVEELTNHNKKQFAKNENNSK